MGQLMPNKGLSRKSRGGSQRQIHAPENSIGKTLFPAMESRKEWGLGSVLSNDPPDIRVPPP